MLQNEYMSREDYVMLCHTCFEMCGFLAIHKVYLCDLFLLEDGTLYLTGNQSSNGSLSQHCIRQGDMKHAIQV